MMKFTGFASLDDVQMAFTRPGWQVYYHAPMDYQPRSVGLIKRLKNGKLRLTCGGLTFTVDASHLDRFKHAVVGFNA